MQITQPLQPTRSDAVVSTETIGEAWIDIAARILADGRVSSYDGLPITELLTVTLRIARAQADDPLIARHADVERLAWMRTNFTDHARVSALGDADSYATRLYDYDHTGRDQIAWVIDRLRADPLSRSAAISTFQPLTDTSYIPCVSMLDFWIPQHELDLVVYAHSIDFGAKGYGNLVQLAELQERVAAELGIAAGRLTMIIKSAHIYDTELASMRGVVAATGR
jgi:thymidylate synthase